MAKGNKKVKTMSKASRSRVYPRYGLEECVGFLRLIDKVGGQRVSQGTLLDELKKKNPNDAVFTGKVSSCKQFGLLEVSKKTYSITERGKLILYPVPDRDTKKLLLSAFNSPSLYQEIIGRFSGRKLPTKQTLGNILFNEFRIAKNAKNRAASVFIKSAEHAGALKGGILQIEGLTGGQQPEGAVKKVGFTPEIPEAAEGNQALKIAISGGTANIVVPRKLSGEDKKKLKLFIDNL